MFSKIALAKMIDHSLLRPDATEDDVIRCCEEAKELHFACVMVLPFWCQIAEKRLRGSDVKVGTVV
ncbi:MAG: 2-deoxyribose-5-phosphate aldolase, partial [Armatimonadota bacterium]